MPPPAPLFRDPIYDGAADPTIIWNRQESNWWILYTNRRASAEGSGVAWAHGTDIGVACFPHFAALKSGDPLESGAAQQSSTPPGSLPRPGHQEWLYRGTLRGLEFEPGRNSFWAPEVLWHDGLYHMYVSYVRGVPATWNWERHIVHMSSANLWDWSFESILALSSDRVIDACVFALPGGGWRMWYKDEANHSFSYAADSPDLYHWNVRGPAVTDCAHEGPNVFAWRGRYWMITDYWNGLGVYHSDDLETWTRQANILSTPGSRPDDGALGHHADVLVQGERAYIFYFTHPEVVGMGSSDMTWTYARRRTSLQAAELELEGGCLVCDRDRPFELELHTSQDS